MKPSKLWVDFDSEFRQLFEIVKADGGLLFYLDRSEVFEFEATRGFELPPIDPDEVQSVSVTPPPAKGLHTILTRGGGSWLCYLLRRGLREHEPRHERAAGYTEENAIELEEADAEFYRLPVQRLREIRAMSFFDCIGLGEFERHYWLATQERRGENADKLRAWIAREEQAIAEARLSDYKGMVGDALKSAEAAGAAPGKAAALTPAQRKRNVEAARAKGQIEPRGVALIQREFEHVRGTAKRRGEIVAERCVSGRWTHSQINETVSRKDGAKITGRYVCDLLKRHKPQKKKRLP